MSTTTHSTGQHASQAADKSPAKRALDRFESIAWTNRTVCSSCFARIKGTFQGTFERRDGHTVDIDESWRTPSATLGQDLEEPPDSAVGVAPLARPKTVCLECGSVGALAPSDTRTRRECLAVVPNLVARAREAGHAVDDYVVRQTVRYLKSNPETEASEKHIFATALSLGIDRA